jgi:hypothetical protein
VTITYPRIFPITSFIIESTSFELVPMVNVQPNLFGASLYTDIGPALWQSHFKSREITPLQLGDVRAWLDTLQNGKTFFGYDALRLWPAAYPLGANAFTWPVPASPFTCKLVTANPGLPMTVVINDLPAGYVISVGDYISWSFLDTTVTPNVTRYSLHRFVEGATAVAPATSITLEVRPPIRPGFWPSGTPRANLASASCTMQVLPGTPSEQITSPDLCVISFDAKQVI